MAAWRTSVRPDQAKEDDSPHRGHSTISASVQSVAPVTCAAVSFVAASCGIAFGAAQLLRCCRRVRARRSCFSFQGFFLRPPLFITEGVAVSTPPCGRPQPGAEQTRRLGGRARLWAVFVHCHRLAVVKPAAVMDLATCAASTSGFLWAAQRSNPIMSGDRRGIHTEGLDRARPFINGGKGKR